MNQEQILGVVRHILSTYGGVLVAQGYATTDQTNMIIGGIVGVISVIWSYFAKRNKS